MDGLKQRVVGALVIVSLAVIFLPMIFDEPHQPSKTQLIPIPVQSELPVITLNSPQKPKFKLIEPSDAKAVEIAPESTVETDSSTVGRAADTANSDIVSSDQVSDMNDQAPAANAKVVEKKTAEKVEKKKTPKTPTFKEKELSNVWMVQLGTFGNHKNAYNLRDSLRKDGFDGHTTNVEKDGKQLVRVFSGPYADKAHADKIKKQLDKKFKLKTLVVHFK